MKPSIRLLYAAPALICAALLGYGYYLQYFDSQDPCPLCLVQRAFYYGILLVFTVAAVHSPGKTGNANGIVINPFIHRNTFFKNFFTKHINYFILQLILSN